MATPARNGANMRNQGWLGLIRFMYCGRVSSELPGDTLLELTQLACASRMQRPHGRSKPTCRPTWSAMQLSSSRRTRFPATTKLNLILQKSQKTPYLALPLTETALATMLRKGAGAGSPYENLRQDRIRPPQHKLVLNAALVAALCCMCCAVCLCVVYVFPSITQRCSTE